MYGWLLLLHVLGAVIWAGGHIALSVAVLPQVMRKKSPELLLAFESRFEKVGMPALIVQVVTGVLLALKKVPDISQWLNFSNPAMPLIAAKLFFLTLTVLLAVDAKWRVLPDLTPEKLTDMAWHVVAVTVLSILLVIVGVSFRTGWFY